MILWIHPVLQTLAVLASLFVLYLGFLRFRFAHLGHKGVIFPWKRHALLGTVVMGIWGLAFFIGLGAAWWSWESVFITGRHYQLGLLMLPFILFGLGSGIIMDRVKAKRAVLPLVHGAVNVLLVLMALAQLYTGGIILRNMVMG